MHFVWLISSQENRSFSFSLGMGVVFFDVFSVSDSDGGFFLFGVRGVDFLGCGFFFFVSEAEDKADDYSDKDYSADDQANSFFISSHL